MACETCGLIERYGIKKRDGRRLCLDCWRNEQKSDQREKTPDVKKED